VVVLVGPWTGSMGEGTAIGLHAARGAPVLGQPMAALVGGLGTVTLGNSRLQVKLPTEMLHHVDGTPREDFRPCAVLPGVLAARGGQPTLRAADGSAVADAELLQAAAVVRRLRDGAVRATASAPGQGCPAGG
jgi:hypothetical protein